MKKVDILLIKPGSQKQLYGALSDFKLTAIEPPLWAAIWAGFLREKGYSVVMLDAEVENLNYAETARKAVDVNPLLTVVVASGSNPSASTMNMIGAAEIIRNMNQLQPEMKTMLAGLHPSALPERTMAEIDVDFLCQGEGFYTIPQLLDTLRANNDDFRIKGLFSRADGKIITNPSPPLLKDLDSLPRPAWDLLPMRQYRAHNWHCFDNIAARQPYAVLYTSLGCPFRCSFCCINALFGKNTIRYRSIDSVLDEIDFLVNTYNIKNIKIIDEMFGLKESRVTALCDAITARGYDLNMWAYARVDTVTPRMLAKMKEAGINWVAYGFESGSKRVIENATKGYKMERVEEVVRMTYDLGMYICANFIFGLPEDDYDSMNETLKLMLDINAEWANIYSAMAFPGSRLYDQALEKGWPLPEGWQGYSQYSQECLPLATNYLSGSQVLAFRDYAFDTYYRSPRYLDMIKKKFGEQTFDHVREMAARTLNRKHLRV